MAEFFIDAEPLSFAGPLPASLADLIAAVEPVLHERGRVLAAIKVDGLAVGEEISSASWLDAGTVEVCSISLTEAYSQLGASLATRVESLLADGEKMASDVLRHAWPEIASPCIALATGIGELLRDAQGVVQGCPESADPANDLAESTFPWVAGIEKGDAAAICLALDRRVLPALRAFLETLRQIGSSR